MRHRLLAVVVLCTLVTALLVFVSAASSPLGEIEEHFELGRQWRTTGAFPAVLRPPGYPAFVALTLLARATRMSAIVGGALVLVALGSALALTS